MGKVVKLTESDLAKIIKRVISEQSRPGVKRTSYYPIANFDNTMNSLGLKKSGMGDFYTGVSNGVTYKFYANGPNGQGTYHTVAVNSNTTGEYVFDKTSSQPFKGIKILTSRPEQARKK